MPTTTAFVPPTTGPQFIVSGKTATPANAITITTSPTIPTDSQLVQFILANTFVSIPNLVMTAGQGKVADPTGAGTFIVPDVGLLEVGTVGGDPNGTIFTQRLNVIAPTLPKGESETADLNLKTATSATQGGPLDSNVANQDLKLFFVSPPAITGTVANQPVAANGTIKPFATTVIRDTDFQAAAKDVASITITDGGTPTDNDGILVGAGLSKTGVGTYTIPNAVAPDQLATELQGLSFNAPNVFGTHNITFDLAVQDVPQGIPAATVPPGEDVIADLTSKDTTTSLSVVGPTPPPAGNNFHVVDLSNNTITDTPGTPYTGPVAGIQNELIMITPDKLNISAVTPNTFIHSGSGTDAIDVSGANGTNVLDGFTGTNFLVGGTGKDQFFVDDRNATADIFSTVKNFHTGDTATVWGITQAGFAIKTGDDVLPAAPGLDFAFTAAGKPNANLNIPGYTTADLTNGRLNVSFGHTPDLPGLPGSDFMLIAAT